MTRASCALSFGRPAASASRATVTRQPPLLLLLPPPPPPPSKTTTLPPPPPPPKLEDIATDPNASGGVCSSSVPQLLNLNLSRPSAIASTAAATTTREAAAASAPGRKKAPAVKKDPGAAAADDSADGHAAAKTAEADDDDDDDEDARNQAQEAAHRLAREAVSRMSMKEREETLASLAREGWLEARQDMAGHYCIGVSG
jgi:hypothetical protein